MRRLKNLLPFAVLGCVVIAGSCSVSTNTQRSPMEDGAANHPISVEPSYRDLKLDYNGQALSAADARAFDGFIDDYRLHGNGSLAISVPQGGSARGAISYFAERAAQSGISRDRILVSTHDVIDGDYRIDISYISYVAHTDRCEDWSQDLAYTADNLTPRNFGCAVQHNIAAMVADPRDLVQPQKMDGADGARAASVMSNYDQGKPTAAVRTEDQSGAVSDVNKQ